MENPSKSDEKPKRWNSGIKVDHWAKDKKELYSASKRESDSCAGGETD